MASLYFGQIVVIAVSDLEKPVLMDNPLNLYQKNITNLGNMILENNIIYVLSDSSALVTIDISDIRNPQLLGTVMEVKNSFGFSLCRNGYAYLAGGIEGIHIISVINVRNPRFNSSYYVNGSSISSITCRDNILYAVTNDLSPSLFAFNVGNPSFPVPIYSVPISAKANSIGLNRNGNICFIATNQGIDIFDISNQSSATNITSISLSFEVFSLDLSDTEEYLVVTGDTILMSINIQTLTQFAIVDSLSFEYGLNQVLFFPSSNYGFIASTAGFETFQFFSGVPSRISPYIGSISQSVLNGTQMGDISVSDYYYFVIALINGWQHLVIKNSTKDYNTTLKELNLTCSDLNSSSILLSLKNKTCIYVTNCGNLTRISLKTPETAMIESSWNIDQASYLAFSVNEDFIYISNRKTLQIHIFSISNSLFINFTLPGVPGTIISSEDDKTLFVSVENSGLIILNVTEKSHPSLVNYSFIPGSVGNIKSMFFFKNINQRQYLIATQYFEGLIKIFDVTDPSSLIVIGKRYIGKRTAGIGLFANKNFFVVQSFNKLSVVEIRDITNPVIVSTFNLNFDGTCSRIGIIQGL